VPSYTLHFAGPDSRVAGEAHTFEAETEHRAMVKAAILYAGSSLQAVPPTAYRILGPSGELIYRYPEE
jgi:hypothetical protein